MIPNVIPPPPWLPQGWSPNALGAPPQTATLLASGVVPPLGLSSFYLRLTNAMILAGADVTMVGAPGVGRASSVLNVLQIHTNTLAAVYNTTRTIILAYANNPTIGLTSAQNIVVAATAKDVQRFAAGTGSLAPGTTFNNQAILAHFSGGNTGGNVADYVDLVATIFTTTGLGL